jgi:hypothetical protein
MAENRFFTIYVNSKPPGPFRTENRRCRAPCHRRLLVAFGFGASDRFGVEINGRKSFFLPFMSTPKPLDMPGPKIGGAGLHAIAVYLWHSVLGPVIGLELK